MKELVRLFRKSSLRAIGWEDLRLISFYDDEIYSNIDYDVLDGSLREKVRRLLLAEDWVNKGSREFSKDTHKCRFPKPSGTLGTSPSDVVLDERKRAPGSYIFVTPTQALLVQIATNTWDLRKSLELVKHQPANLDKVIQWQSEMGLNHIKKQGLEELRALQEEGIKKRKESTTDFHPAFLTVEEALS